MDTISNFHEFWIEEVHPKKSSKKENFVIQML